MKNRVRILPAIILILALALSACATATPARTESPVTTEVAQSETTQPPEPTQAPTEEPAPTGTPAETEASASDKPQSLTLATTTSTQDSGLLDFILPQFQRAYNVTVDVIAVGTGQALQLGVDGNADVLLVHARAREDDFMAAGDGVRREDVMYNDFVLVGPESDPAGVAGMTDAASAFKKIADAQAPFVSRGDDSGTHTKEKSVWAAAGIEPTGDWYISAGQGMGAVLTMADEQQAYTLSDRATYLARTLEGTDLKILVEGDPVLFNPYGVIAVNPAKSPQIKNALANTFIDWLVSLPTQELISTFGVDKFGSPLFTPDSDAWRNARKTETTSLANAALKVTGAVNTEMGWSEEAVKSMKTKTVQGTNDQGSSEEYTGVPVMTLLDMAGLQPQAASVVFVGDDGYSAEAGLADLQACTECIVSFRNQGGFSLVMPGFSGNVEVKGVVEFQVK